MGGGLSRAKKLRYAAASPGQKIDPNAVLSPAAFRKKIVVQQAKFQTPPRRNNRDSYELDREEYSSSDADSDSGSDSNSEAQREGEVAEEVPETDSVEDEDDDDDDESMKRPYSARDEAIEEKNVAEQTAAMLFDVIPQFHMGDTDEMVMQTCTALLSHSMTAFSILLSSREEQSGNTVVHIAAAADAVPLLRLFLSSRASADVNVTNWHGQSPLHMCCNSGSETTEAAELLLAHGAWVDLADTEGSTPLICAAAYGNAPAVKLLLEHGAMPSARDLHGYRPVDWASHFCHYDVMHLLGSGEKNPTWIEYFDTEHRTSYFYNTITGESTWTRPAEMDAEAEGSNRAFLAALGEEKVEEEPSTANALPRETPIQKWRRIAWRIGRSRLRLKRRQALQQMDSKAPTSQGSPAAVQTMSMAATIGIQSQIQMLLQMQMQMQQQMQQKLASPSASRTDTPMSGHARNFSSTPVRTPLRSLAASASSKYSGRSPLAVIQHRRAVEMESQLLKKEREVHELQSSPTVDKIALAKASIDHSALQAQLSEQQKTVRSTEERAHIAREAEKRDLLQVQEMMQCIKEKERQIAETQKDLQRLRESSDSSADEMRRITAQQAEQLRQAKELAAAHAQKIHEMKQSHEETQRELIAAKERALKQRIVEKEREEMEKKLRAMEQENSRLRKDFEVEQTRRRKLHHQVESLKGSVRVICRIRPLSSSERERECAYAVDFPSKNAISLMKSAGGPPSSSKSKYYEFDTVLRPTASQEKVSEQVLPLIQSVVDGYNVCIFAYGQTSSGKTYTLLGPDGGKNFGNGDVDDNAMGVCPRAMRELFAIKDRNSHHDIKFSFSSVELYRDELHDLLWGTSKSKGAQRPKLIIRKDPVENITSVDGMTEVPVESFDDLMSLIASGNKARHTSQTMMNSTSSRSHLIMSVKVESTNRTSGRTTISKLQIVDLAGSESQKKTGAEGDRFKEAKSINKSLSALGNVIAALTSKAKFVPYRNSKLTLLLQDGLGGNAKTLMFVNLSPADYNALESINSCEFASRVKNVTNSSQKVIENKQIRLLKEQLERLKAAGSRRQVSGRPAGRRR